MWLADDSAGAGRLRELHKWWDTLCETGKLYGYFTNCSKTTLLVQNDLVAVAEDLFAGTGVQILTDGARYLGNAVGGPGFRASYLLDKVNEWLEELKVLTTFALTEPHAAHAALHHGLRSRYTFLIRTLPDTGGNLQRIDKLLAEEFLPAISSRKGFTSDDLALMRLPARLGGIGLPSFAETAEYEFNASKAMTQAQVEEIPTESPPRGGKHRAVTHISSPSEELGTTAAPDDRESPSESADEWL